MGKKARMPSARLRLAHGWTLTYGLGISPALLSDFIRPAVRAAPSSLGRRLGFTRIAIPGETEAHEASRWKWTKAGLDASIAAEGVDGHDVALELLECLGQALWEKLWEAERRAYWKLLDDEIRAGVQGEIDEPALAAKRALFESRAQASDAAALLRYGRASFAGTAAEYVHCLWHEVTVRTGPDYLPAPALRRRLELMARWFPPDRGYRLFPPARRQAGRAGRRRCGAGAGATNAGNV
jgi:hypothetical protein